MALSYEEFTGTGAQTQYAVSFPYISRDHVSLKVDGVAKTITWINSALISVAVAPALDTTVRVARTTPTTALTDFSNGSTLGEDDLDRVLTQNLYVSQESTDLAEDSLRIATDGTYDAGARRISDVADPIADQDAVTKAYGDLHWGGTVSADAIAARDAAIVAADDAEAALAATLDAAMSLPTPVADTMLLRNAGNTAYDTKTLSEIATLLATYLNPFTTGDVKPTLKSVADTGWVLMNDGSIGNASSTATTRANADTSALFTLLWTNLSDTWAPVSTGRGASAAADFAANKRLTLPKALGRALAAAGAGSGLTSRSLGETLGAETVVADLAAHTHAAGTLAADSAGSHTHDIPGGGDGGVTALKPTVASSTNGGAPSVVTPAMASAGAHAHTVSGTSASTGAGGGHANMQPTMFLNFMVKL